MIKKIGVHFTSVLMLSIFIIPLAGCSKTDSLVFSGTIESTQIEAGSEVAGKVVKLEKSEGDAVKQGDLLADLDSGLQELVVKQQEEVVAAKKAKLDELKAGTRPEQVEQAVAAAKTADLAVKNAGTGVYSAQTSYDYWLEKYNNVSTLNKSSKATENDVLDAKYKLDTAKQQLDIAKKQLQSAQAQLQSANAQLELLKKGSTNQTIQAAEADLGQSQAALDQARLVLGKYQVKAPVDGTLISKNVEIGSMASTGTSIFTISDLTDLWTSIYVQQKYLKYVTLNQDIGLKASALGSDAIKGRVVSIASEAEFTPKNVETDDAKENTVFKVKIKILDRIGDLKPGMTVDAVIPLGG